MEKGKVRVSRRHKLLASCVCAREESTSQSAGSCSNWKWNFFLFPASRGRKVETFKNPGEKCRRSSAHMGECPGSADSCEHKNYIRTFGPDLIVVSAKSVAEETFLQCLVVQRLYCEGKIRKYFLTWLSKLHFKAYFTLCSWIHVWAKAIV